MVRELTGDRDAEPTHALGGSRKRGGRRRHAVNRAKRQASGTFNLRYFFSLQEESECICGGLLAKQCHRMSNTAAVNKKITGCLAFAINLSQWYWLPAAFRRSLRIGQVEKRERKRWHEREGLDSRYKSGET